MSKPYYRVSIKKDVNTWYYLNNGVVDTDNTEHYFFKYIDKWQEMGYDDERNIRMSGLFRKYSNTYRFVLDLAKIMRNIYYTQGDTGIGILYVERLNKDTQFYEKDFEADLDFSTFRDERDYSAVEIKEKGVAEKIKSREDIKYEVSATGSLSKTAEIQPLKLLGQCRFLTGQTSGLNGNFLNWIQLTWVNEVLAKVSDTPANKPISYITPESSNGFVKGEFELTGTSWATTSGAYSNYLLKAEVALSKVSVRIDLPVFLDNLDATALSVKATIYTYNTGVGAETKIYETAAAAVAGNSDLLHTFSIEHTIDSMSVNDVIVIVLESNKQTQWQIKYENDVRLDIDFQHYTDTFQVKGVSIFDLAKELVSQITDGAAIFQSNLLGTNTNYTDGLDCNPKDILILSGDSIRGISDALIKVSLKDLLKAIDVWFSAGLGVEGNTVRIERKEYFFKNNTANEIADLGDIVDCVYEHATDFLYNELQIGYAEQEYDEINGKDEPNTTAIYQFNRTNEKNMLDMISPVRGDGYGIFYTWANYVLSEQKDSTSDNSLFALQISSTATMGVYDALYPQDIDASASISGYLEPQRLMNPGLTPMHCVRRNARYLYSMVFATGALNSTVSLLRFQSISKNRTLSLKITTSYAMKLTDNIQLNGFGNRLFLPIIANIETQSPKLYNQLFESNRYGYFTYNWQGVINKGFVLKSSGINAVPRIHKYRLLLTPDTDTTLLQR